MAIVFQNGVSYWDFHFTFLIHFIHNSVWYQFICFLFYMYIYVNFCLKCCVYVNMSPIWEREGETLNMAMWLWLVSKSDFCELKSKSVDWIICIVCQNPNDENCICPANNINVALRNAGYATFAKNLRNFDNIKLLMDINTKVFDESRSQIKETFLKRQAKRHKKCALKCNSPHCSKKSKLETCWRQEWRHAINIAWTS